MLTIDTRRVIHEAIEFGLPDKALWNCHAANLCSIVLFNEPGAPAYGYPKMTRIFVALPGCTLNRLYNGDGSYIVGVHNHRYDIGITPVCGTLINYEPWITEKVTNRPVWEFAFQSGIKNEEINLKLLEKLYIRDENYRYLPVGETHRMEAEQVHTVLVPSGHKLTAWIVEEGEDRLNPLFYSTIENPSMESELLYRNMDTDTAERILYRVLEEME